MPPVLAQAVGADMETEEIVKNEYRIREDGIAEMVLASGRIALIDAADVRLVANVRWQSTRAYPRTYVRGYTGLRDVSLHRYLMNPSAGMLVDHVDGDALNNKRSNLRVCTPSENQRNRRAKNGNRSGKSGVYWHSKNRRWIARIIVGRTVFWSASFRSLDDAISARIARERQLYGAFAPSLGVELVN